VSLADNEIIFRRCVHPLPQCIYVTFLLQLRGGVDERRPSRAGALENA
jgi:hypothetical protein